MHRPKHSDKRLDERLEEQEHEREQASEPRGIFELFQRDEDAPLARDDEDDETPR